MTETGPCPDGEHRWAPWDHEPSIEPARTPHWIRWCCRCNAGEVRRTHQQPDTLDPFVRGEEVFRPRLFQSVRAMPRFGPGPRRVSVPGFRNGTGGRLSTPRT